MYALYLLSDPERVKQIVVVPEVHRIRLAISREVKVAKKQAKRIMKKILKALREGKRDKALGYYIGLALMPLILRRKFMLYAIGGYKRIAKKLRKKIKDAEKEFIRLLKRAERVIGLGWFDRFKSWFSSKVKSASRVVSSIKRRVTSVVNRAKSVASSLISKAKKSTGYVRRYLYNKAKSVLNRAKSYVNKAKSTINKIKESVKNTAKKVFTSYVVKPAKTVAKKTANIVKSAYNKGKTVVRTVFHKVSSVPKKIYDYAKKVGGTILKKGREFYEKARKIVETVKNNLFKKPDKAKIGIGGPNLVKIGLTISGTLKKIVEEAVNSIKKKVSKPAVLPKIPRPTPIVPTVLPKPAPPPPLPAPTPVTPTPEEEEEIKRTAEETVKEIASESSPEGSQLASEIPSNVQEKMIGSTISPINMIKDAFTNIYNAVKSNPYLLIPIVGGIAIVGILLATRPKPTVVYMPMYMPPKPKTEEVKKK